MRRPARALVVLALLLSACRSQPPSARHYQLSGQVLAVRTELREILIKHEDIPGFMPGMMMPFKVRDEQLLSGRQPGELVTATLLVEDTEAWLTAIDTIGQAPLPDAPLEPSLVSAATMVDVGDLAPQVQLTDQTGTQFNLNDWRGRAVAITFIYTRCPLPQFCPVMDRRFAEMQRLVAADTKLSGRVQLLSVSFDPEHDSPRVLATHASKLGADPRTWIFATGPVPVVDAFAARFGVSVMRERDRTITHNLRTAVVDPDGRVAALYTGNEWTADVLAADVRKALARESTSR